jgi:hypothetical protein
VGNRAVAVEPFGLDVVDGRLVAHRTQPAVRLEAGVLATDVVAGEERLSSTSSPDLVWQRR